VDDPKDLALVDAISRSKCMCLHERTVADPVIVQETVKSLSVATLMGPAPRVFATLMGPPFSPGSWGHPRGE
jgi:hypothetical protein